MRSLANSLQKLGHKFEWVREPSDLDKADKLLFPGVGSFGHAMDVLRSKGYVEPLRAYLRSGKPYMGICIGLQALFEGSDESPGAEGLGVLPARVGRFSVQDAQGRHKAVPHMGWSTAHVPPMERAGAGAGTASVADVDHLGERFGLRHDAHFYFVHSYRVAFSSDAQADWVLATSQYGDESFVSVVQHGNIFATQFHPEKSGRAGLAVLDAWLRQPEHAEYAHVPRRVAHHEPRAAFARPVARIVACLDVRSNDEGDLVVTKGESYDVRDKVEPTGGAQAGTRAVRNMGKPVELAQRYYDEGADEITFLNITSFRSCPLQDQPMLELLERAAESIFVPLTIGGGIRDMRDPDGTLHPALEVAQAYFRAGADKVSIGSDAVYAVEQLRERAVAAGAPADLSAVPDAALSGDTPLEQISRAYGAQALVVSVDPRRVYLEEQEPVPAAHAASVVHGVDERAGREGRAARWWYRCTVKGGREDRDVDVVQLARGTARLGAGELLINSIDRDGSNRGFDTQLIDTVRGAVDIPVIASSGAGVPEHFAEVFAERAARHGAPVEAALAAGIFHRRQCTIGAVKQHLAEKGYPVRLDV